MSPTSCINYSGFSTKSKVGAFYKSQCQTEKGGAFKYATSRTRRMLCEIKFFVIRFFLMILFTLNNEVK